MSSAAVPASVTLIGIVFKIAIPLDAIKPFFMGLRSVISAALEIRTFGDYILINFFMNTGDGLFPISHG